MSTDATPGRAVVVSRRHAVIRARIRIHPRAHPSPHPSPRAVRVRPRAGVDRARDRDRSRDRSPDPRVFSRGALFRGRTRAKIVIDRS
jgi:hypothetical protein